MPKKHKARKKRPRKAKDSGQKEEMKKLEMERSALEEKNKHLLQIIEEISKARPEPEEEGEEKESTESEKEEKTGNAETKKEKPKSLLDLKEFGERIKEKFEENKSKGDFKKDLDKIVKEKIDSKFSELSEDLKKVSNLEDKMNKLAEKITTPVPVPTPQLVPPEAYGAGEPQTGTISKGLASFGEEIDLETELLEIRNSIKDLNKNLENLKKKSDFSITNIEDKIKLLEKIPQLEESFQNISEKLGPDNVQKLRKLIFSADELVDEVIPDLLGKKLRAKLGPTISEVKSLKHNIGGLRTGLNNLRTELLNLQKTKEDIKALELEKDRLYKEVIGRDAKFREGIDILKENIKKRIEGLSAELSGKLNESQIANYQKIEKDINKIFSDVIQLRFSEMEKVQLEFGEKIRKLDLTDDQLKKKLNELKAPEGVKKWVGIQLKSIQSQTIPEIKSIKNEISKNTQTQKESIERLITDKKTLTKMIGELKSEIGILSEKIVMEKERISGLESELDAKGTDLTTDLDKQKKILTDLRLEIGKMIEGSVNALKEELEKERTKDLEDQANELRSEISKIQFLKNELDEYKKKQESELGELISNLKDIPPDIKILRERIGNLENLGKKLDKDKINEPEFSSIVKMITKRVGEIEDHFDEIEDGIAKNRSQIEKRVGQLLSDDRLLKSAQESVGKVFDERIEGLDKALSSNVKSLSEELKSNSDMISYLRERTQALDSLTGGMPKKLESQEALLNKVMESKEFLAKRSESVATELRSLTQNLSSEAERIAVLEQDLKNQGGNQESRFDELSRSVSSIQGIVPQVNTLRENIKRLETETRNLDKKLSSFKPPESLKKWFNDKIQELDKKVLKNIGGLSKDFEENSDLILEMRKKLPVLDSLISESKEHEKDISGLLERIRDLDSLLKGVPKKLESQEALLNKIMESKEFLAKRSESVATELKSLSGNLSSDRDRLMALEQRIDLQDKTKESRIDEIAKGLVRAEDRLSEIDVIKTKIDELESVGKSLGEKSIGESEFVSTVKSVSKRIDDIEGLYQKLDKEFGIDKTKLQAAINQALSDGRVLKSVQGSLGKWLEEELQKLNRKLSSDTERMSRQLEEKSESLSKKLYSDLEKLSKQLDEKSGPILGIKEKLSALETLTNQRTESLNTELNALKEKLDSEKEEETGLEKEFRSHSKAQEKRLDGLDKSLAGIQNSTQNSSLKIGVLKERLNDIEKRFEQSVKKSMEEKHLLKEELKKQGERVGRILRELSE